MSDVDFEAQLLRAGCIDVFQKMEACLSEFDRDWRACQEDVKTFKKCMQDKAIQLNADVVNKD